MKWWRVGGVGVCVREGKSEVDERRRSRGIHFSATEVADMSSKRESDTNAEDPRSGFEGD